MVFNLLPDYTGFAIAHLLSVVTVNLNNREGLLTTYRSIRSLVQGGVIEWIVIDGDSNDGSIEQLFLEAPYLKFGGLKVTIASEFDSGVYDAMNKGLRMSAGDFLLFLNSGDEVIDDKVLKEFIFGDSKDIKSDYSYLFGFEYEGVTRTPKPSYMIYWKMLTSHQSIIFSRNQIATGEYSLAYRYASDYELLWRVIRSKKFKILRSVLSRNATYGLSNKSPAEMRFEYYKVCSSYSNSIVSGLILFVKTIYEKLFLERKRF